MWLIDVLIILIGYIQCIESDIQNVLKWEYMTVCRVSLYIVMVFHYNFTYIINTYIYVNN